MNRIRTATTLLLLVAALGCRAQQKLTPQQVRRTEVAIRSKFNIPAYVDVTIGDRHNSDTPGFDAVTVTFTNLEVESGKVPPPKSVEFLISQDGKTLAQLSRMDISFDPATIVTDDGRPSRGGPASAPVHIVVFDDLQCPYCARMHAQMFPAVLQRYGDKVRIVYKDFPLGQHPWAIHAAVDANCLAAESPTAYWALVDNIHAHAGDVPPVKPSPDSTAKPEEALKPATDTLDKWTREEAARQKVDLAVLNTCIARQDASAVLASAKEGDSLGVDATPVLFINGEKLSGALPLKYVYKMIDGALLAAGITPPPPPSADTPAAAPAAK